MNRTRCGAQPSPRPPVAAGDDLGEDRQRRLCGRGSAEVETDRRRQPLKLLLGHTRAGPGELLLCAVLDIRAEILDDRASSTSRGSIPTRSPLGQRMEVATSLRA